MIVSGNFTVMISDRMILFLLCSYLGTLTSSKQARRGPDSSNLRRNWHNKNKLFMWTYIM